MSQTQQILEHLKSIDKATGQTRGLTAFEAIGLYRCYRLAARVKELRQQGHNILTIVKRDNTGKKYGKYYLNTNKHCRREGSVLTVSSKRKG
jgi:hypothetical protein